MIVGLPEPWELLPWDEVQQRGLKAASDLEDANVWVHNPETGEVLSYPELHKRHIALQK